MLELKKIRKEYPAGAGKVEALKDVDLAFRQSEFVSVLGPSGCGKTTMLNIIGGLDQYTSGDLMINGRSTKDFSDRDWDTYRNHSIGFIFQSYHLIPHQSVLRNVELALTLSGVSRKERRARAKQALEEVGLGDQLSKKPNEMSGGQMQRVAIARALVNNPDIILADEPTGALDTETSVQVMDILKKVSENRLVIMVTHNPDLAEKYSTRIIRMLDGVITDDSMPLTAEELDEARQKAEKPGKKAKREKKSSMSFGTAFMLSFKNLVSKKGRTLLTSFAGSIGIIGIALILAISQGMTTYINTVQEEALSSYPITIQGATMDMSAMMLMFMESVSEESDRSGDAVYQRSATYDMVNAMNSLEMRENDLRSFKVFLDEQLNDPASALYPAISSVQYGYDLPLMVYTRNVDGEVASTDATKLMTSKMGEFLGMDLMSLTTMMQSNEVAAASIAQSNEMFSLWEELLPGKDGAPVSDVVKNQYDLVYGAWPNSYDQVVVVVDENNELEDMSLYALGLLPEAEMDKIMAAAVDGTKLEKTEVQWTYEEICNLQYRVVLPADCYVLDEATGLYRDLRTTDAGMRYLYDNGLPLKVVGIIRPNPDAAAAMMTGAIAYTSALTEYVVTKSSDSAAIKAQQASPTVDVITGLPFESNTGSLTAQQKAADFRAHVESLTDADKAAVYVRIKSIPSEEIMTQAVTQALSQLTREDMETTLSEGLKAQMGLSDEEIGSYVTAMSDEDLQEIFAGMIAQQVEAEYALQVAEKMNEMPAIQLNMAFAMEMMGYTDEQCALYYDEVMEFSPATLESNLLTLGYMDLEDPASVNIFASSFANKDVVEAEIARYNADKDDMSRVKYTDFIGIMLSSITTIIDAITYVLIAFVAISLVVSSIMIGVITLISVQERTKEIGILRALGASKRNVSSMFTAETVIIGFSSGALGVLVTLLMCIPINAILYALTGIANLRAFVPAPAAIILVIISVVLTLISGMIPSRSAARKDPVVALRTE
ncbi:MAG: ABC transporter ATP-binding protein/permease [Clostridiales bacterium]|nr:ABC transporter ATP-binding protein/permease [Clostridiales bacterium]